MNNQSRFIRTILISTFLLTTFFGGCKSSIVDDPETSIRFSVPQDSHVKLTIENSYNTQVAKLVDENKTSGHYNVSFSANDLAEGVYFYTLELKGINNNFYSKTTKNMLLVK
ncbi:MAG: hypothetical protein WC209_00225 [Ignavibacteriaceae bacterium]|jgi:hypothetical protein